ncbi:hypothetical protein TNCV_3287761 [Trichonephila clavipes]|nr:hypothetical protein TNCV_3287761 [Trichonephila clavipes]
MNRRNRSLDQLTFREALPRQLMDRYSSRKRKGCHASFQAKKCVVPEDVRLASVRNLVPKKGFPTKEDIENVSERDKKKRLATCVQNVMTPWALKHASHPFMANNLP